MPAAPRAPAAVDLDLAGVARRLARHQPRLMDPERAPRRAAVAAILRPGDDGPGCQLLFIRRAEVPGDPWSGHMAFPGGRMDPGDADPLRTALRETQEEVGLDLAARGELLGRLDDVQGSAGGRVLPLAISPFVFALPGAAELRPNEEVAAWLWAPLLALASGAHRSTVPYDIAGQRYDLPCLRVQGQVIWGLTYQMLMKLLAALGLARG